MNSLVPFAMEDSFVRPIGRNDGIAVAGLAKRGVIVEHRHCSDWTIALTLDEADA